MCRETETYSVRHDIQSRISVLTFFVHTYGASLNYLEDSFIKFRFRYDVVSRLGSSTYQSKETERERERERERRRKVESVIKDDPLYLCMLCVVKPFYYYRHVPANSFKRVCIMFIKLKLC